MKTRSIELSSVACHAIHLPTVPPPCRSGNARLPARWYARWTSFLALALLILPATRSTGFGAAVPLRLEWVTNTLHLVVGPIATQGALFVFAAPDLSSLATSPAILLQTNTPLAAEARMLLSVEKNFASQGFFKAAHWTGQAPALVGIPAGTYVMAAPPLEVEQALWEGPQTTVTLSRSFLMGKYEVTQAEYKALMSNNPSYYSAATNRPVEQVSWTNATEYCARLTTLQRQADCLPTGWTYRLPTDAEWEYACRAGTTTAFAYGSALRSGMANFNGREEYDATIGIIHNPAGVSLDQTRIVGNYAPNAWGLYDMHGNVWEWCQDRWGDHLPGGRVTDPQGPDTGADRVVRGGCWYNNGRACRSAFRSPAHPEYRGNELGFRVVLAPVSP